MSEIIKRLCLLVCLGVGANSLADSIKNETCHLHLDLGKGRVKPEVIQSLRDKGYIVVEQSSADLINKIKEHELVGTFRYEGSKKNSGLKRHKCKMKFILEKVITKTKLEEPRKLFNYFKDLVHYDLTMANLKDVTATHRQYGKTFDCTKAELRAVAEMPKCKVQGVMRAIRPVTCHSRI